MLTILDKYILKRYLITFLGMLLLFVPIGIMANLAEKIGKIIDNEAPLAEVIAYYGNFTLVIGNLLLPIFLFLSIIFFTSKLASNTEIVAILSSGVSYNRFLRPYFIGAGLVAIFIFVMGMFIVPNASIGFNKFEYTYFKKGRDLQQTSNIFNQLNDTDFIYVKNFDPNRQIGYDFTYERFTENDQLDFKISAQNIRWIEKDSTYRLTSYTKRYIREGNEYIQRKRNLDTLFTFQIDDLTPVSYIADTKNLFELDAFIADQKKKGAANINTYVLVKYKRWALPIAAFVLTIIAVAVSSVKRRGGMGVNLAFGIGVAFIYIFFDKVFGTLAEQSGFSPLLAVLLPNLIFGVVGIFLLQKAKR
ncbi:YjgP/YjgQ family permease [Croceitalea dokdonensis DOKDO 023]|uniref:YjgP/YjgQ family permease n=1 Tax=Croceitalea dokdonensis DOKDO 023 TaxID=1300341 RepID=A0A0P7AUM6_9FLAO|nr:LptF/LptG family permease [Croceitalea dokdonensis]KPM31553.1 YjgP/YjgQ family permease [Croceitalea dokdonensis DOKDO 023]